MKKISRKTVDMSAAKEHLRISTRILGIAWQLRKSAVIGYFIAALVEISASILTIYATAKLGSLLAAYIMGGSTDAIWFWLWVDIAAGALVAVASWGMRYYKRLLYYRLTSWSTKTFMAALCRIDINDFYDDAVRTQMDKVQSSYTWRLSILNDYVLDLIYGILRFLAIALVVAQITWWLIPAIAFFLVPTLLSENKLAKVQWFVWNTKGDERHVFWRIEWLIRQAKNQMELRSSQVRGYLLDKVEGIDRRFYTAQEKEYRTLNRLTVPSKLLEVVGTAIGSIVVLSQFLSGSIMLDRYFSYPVLCCGLAARSMLYLVR